VLQEAIPQKHPVFALLCIAKRFFLRFFDHSANTAGIYCVVIIVGTDRALQTLGSTSHDDHLCVTKVIDVKSATSEQDCCGN
jgi:hypothetical protein